MARARIRGTSEWVTTDMNKVDPLATMSIAHYYCNGLYTSLHALQSDKYDIAVSGPRVIDLHNPLVACTLSEGTLGDGTLGEGTLGEGTLGEGTLGDDTLPPVQAIYGVWGEYSRICKLDFIGLAREFVKRTAFVRFELTCYLSEDQTEWDSLTISIHVPFTKRTKNMRFWTDVNDGCNKWATIQLPTTFHQNVPFLCVYYQCGRVSYTDNNWMAECTDNMRMMNVIFDDPMFAGCDYYMVAHRHRKDYTGYVDCNADLPIVQLLANAADAETASVIMSWGTCS